LTGGFHLAAEWVWGDELEVIAHVEIDPFCQKVLRKHWPTVPIHDDIRTLTIEKIMAYASRFRCETDNGWKPGRAAEKGKLSEFETGSISRTTPTTIDLLTGGFPCQPFSVAGKQRGAEDDRAIWPEMFRVIREVKPTWIIGENVAGIVRMELDNCLSDLESEGYATQAFIVPACAVDAPHRRDRVWIVAYNIKQGLQGRGELGKQAAERKTASDIRQNLAGCSGKIGQDVADTTEIGLQGNGASRYAINTENGRQGLFGCESDTGRKTGCWLPEPDVGRVAHGIPSRVDRLKSLGNAIVPQVVAPIMQAIKTIENGAE